MTEKILITSVGDGVLFHRETTEEVSFLEMETMPASDRDKTHDSIGGREIFAFCCDPHFSGEGGTIYS